LATCDAAGEWRKGAAVAAGVAESDADVLVIADADVWCSGIDKAAAAVQGTWAWAVPHARTLRLNRDASGRVVDGDGMLASLPLDRRPHRAVAGGGLVVMRRDVFEACPMPVMGRREDEVWQTQLYPKFGRPWRGTADLFHLWHEEVGHGG